MLGQQQRLLLTGWKQDKIFILLEYAPRGTKALDPVRLRSDRAALLLLSHQKQVVFVYLNVTKSEM